MFNRAAHSAPWVPIELIGVSIWNKSLVFGLCLVWDATDNIYMKSLFVLALIHLASPAHSDPPPCYPCPQTVNTNPFCGTYSLDKVSNSYSCGDITDTQNKIPLSDSSACTVANKNTIPTTVSCKRNQLVSCEPCCSGPCPPNEPIVSGHGGG